MLIAGFPAGPWATNCYVVATGRGSECIVIDPGKDAADGIADVVHDSRLKPVAVLLTHGHIDHMWSVAPVAGSYDATAWIHPADRHLLSDPLRGFSAQSWELALGGYTFAEPDAVRELSDEAVLELAGLRVAVDHTPGHTWGSVTFRTPYDGAPDVPEVLFSGDLLFAGSIGRTDLPGGDHPTMLRTLASKVLPMDDAIVVLPGHGPQTTIGTERASNPFLRDVAANSASR